MICIKDEDSFKIYGHYDTGQAQNFMIAFERCDETLRACKNEAEIKEWLKYKYIITI